MVRMPYYIAFLLNSRAVPLLSDPNVIQYLSQLNISHISKNGATHLLWERSNVLAVIGLFPSSY